MSGNQCRTCGRLLNHHDDPLSKDCGGDCLKCMADCLDTDCRQEIFDMLSQEERTVLFKFLESGSCFDIPGNIAQRLERLELVRRVKVGSKYQGTEFLSDMHEFFEF